MHIRSTRSAHLALAAVAAGALALTGCSAINPQETKSIVAAVPGVRAEIGPLRVEDLVVVSSGGSGSGSGTLSPDAPGRLSGTLFNGSPSTMSVQFSTQASSPVQVTVPRNDKVMLGSGQGIPPLSQTGGIPGGMTTVKISADTSTLELKVPVVDGTLVQYRSLLPTPSPTGTSTSSSGAQPSSAQPSGTATPSATASATTTATDSGRPSAALSLTPSP